MSSALSSTATSYPMAATLRVNRSTGLRLAGIFLLLLTILLVYEQWMHTGPSKHTVVVTLKGRLGNQLFQVAAADYFRRVTQSSVETTVVFRRNNYSVETDLSQSLLRSLPHFNEISRACPGVSDRRRSLIYEVRYSCDLIDPTRLQTPCTVVDGFFQCPAYAEYGRRSVMNLLRAAPEYEKAKSKFTAIRANAAGRPLIAVHVRRGDYTKRFNRGFLEPLPVDYYLRSAHVMPKGAIYLIFSDDLKWCKKELRTVLKDVADDRIVFVDEKNNVMTLLLMLLSDHNIIANSTFSWWAAFLNENTEKVVCAPKNWFGARVQEKIRIYPKTWVLI